MNKGRREKKNRLHDKQQAIILTDNMAGKELNILNIEKPGIEAVWVILGAQSMNRICSDRNTNEQHMHRRFSSVQASKTRKLKHYTILSLQVASI